MRSLWWALIQYDWCLGKKRLGHREIERKEHVSTQQKTAICTARGEAAEETEPATSLILEF